MKHFLHKFTPVRDLVKETLVEWRNDNCSRLAAALAFYTLFSLAPVLIIVIAIGGMVFGEEAVRGQIVYRLQNSVGPGVARAVQTVLRETSGSGTGATLFGLGTLLFGATIVFSELQDALNTIWQVAPRPGRLWTAVLRKRLLSFGLVLAIGFLVLVFFVAGAVLSAVGRWLPFDSPLWSQLLQGAHFLVSVSMYTVLFALIYWLLPDAKVRWSDVWVGALVSAVLVALGNLMIGVYLARTGLASAYGAAGSLVALLVWVYYSAQIFLACGEFTEVYARWRGAEIAPADEAARVVTTLED